MPTPQRRPTRTDRRTVGAVITLAEALAAGPVVLDGGLATELESRGHDLSSARWSARLVDDDPGAILAAHHAYFAAGAQVATTASYQAAGLPRALRRSVELAQQARDEVDDGQPRWVAASVGPYGAVLADGSEYRGDYGLTVAELRRQHRPTIATLIEAGPDLLAVETIPCLAEVEAVLAEIAGTGIPSWVSLTCAGGRTRAGEPVAEAYAMAGEVEEVVAVGINCSAPDEVSAIVPLAARLSGRPVVAYPNAGEQWDAASRRWTGSSGFDLDLATGWVTDGARLVGGCCRVGPSAIAGLAGRLAV